MTPIAMVSYGPGSRDVGLLVDDGGKLVVLWPDGRADSVDREGDEYRHEHGVMLPIWSTNEIAMACALDYWEPIKC